MELKTFCKAKDVAPLVEFLHGMHESLGFDPLAPNKTRIGGSHM